MAEALFLFTQLELPWELGPPDGRYLVRSLSNGEPEWVVVLGTVGARRPPERPGAFGRTPRASRRLSLRRPPPASPDPQPVAIARATIIDPMRLPAERQARAWLSELDHEHEVDRALAVLNRVLHSHRVAAADPYVHEVSAGQALAIRAGFGEGEHVADGRWLDARELPAARPGGGSSKRRARRGRNAALRPQERLAEMLGARETGLVCEELALRARLDLDHGRTALAAVGLSGALDAALRELPAEQRPDLALRISELQKLKPGVARRARVALGDAERPDEQERSEQHDAAHSGEAESGAEDSPDGRQSDEDVVRHALERLEAVLRARTAAGFGR